MPSWRVPVFSALICFLVTMAAGQPSCDGVLNFGRCVGDTGNFCPKDIDCSCKDGYAFCSCPYYKGPDTDYWYMGAKCDYLWSTWDLVIITVLPAVALAFIVAVTAQMIHCCKTTSKSKERTTKSERRATGSHHNHAFVSEESDYPTFQVIFPDDRSAQAPWKMQVNPRTVNYNGDMTPAVYSDPRSMPQRDYDTGDQRGPQQVSDDLYGHVEKKNTQAFPSRLNYGDTRSLPQRDYDYPEEPQQFPRIAPQGFHQAEYSRDPAVPSTGWGHRSFAAGRH